VIVIISPEDGAAFNRGASVIAVYTATDAGSGISVVSGEVDVGSPIDTSTVGSHELIVKATDRLGNSSSLNLHYQILFLPTDVQRELVKQLQQDLQAQVDQVVQAQGFKSGDTIKLSFEFKDPATGKVITDAVIRAFLSQVLDPKTSKRSIIRFVGAFTFDSQTNQYSLEFATVDAQGNPLAPGLYQLDINFNDGTSFALRFKIS